MLPIPLKNSTGVNLLNPLRIYVSNEYSKVRRVVRALPWMPALFLVLGLNSESPPAHLRIVIHFSTHRSHITTGGGGRGGE